MYDRGVMPIQSEARAPSDSEPNGFWNNFQKTKIAE